MHVPEEIEYFQKKVESHKQGPKSLGYSSPYRQASRFTAALDMMKHVSIKSACDVGCGEGDMLPWLKAAHPELISYLGIDPVEDSLRNAIQRHKEMKGMGSTYMFDVGTLEKATVADAIICIGLFTKKGQDSLDFFEKSIELLADRAQKVLVFDTLSTNMDKPDIEDQMIDPVHLLTICMRYAKQFRVERIEPPYVNMAALYF